MPPAPLAPVRAAGGGSPTRPLRSAILFLIDVAAPALAISVGFYAAATGLVGSSAELAAAVLVPVAVVVLLILGRTRPAARLGAAALLNVEAVLTAAVSPAGMAFAIALPLIAVGIVQPMLRGRPLLVGFIVSGVSAIAGVTAAVFVGPASGAFDPASGVLTVMAFASVTTFALALDWQVTYRLLDALDAAQAEIAARDAAETELDRTSEILSAIVRSSPVATQAFAADRTITIWNPASERVFGWTADELVGKPLPIEMIPLEDRDSSGARIDRTLAGSVQHGDRVRRLTKHGEERWVDIYASPIQDRQGRPIGIAGQLVDVTERVQLDAQLLQAQKMGAIGLLASGIAHDFNNTLAAASGYAELVADATSGSIREEAMAVVDVLRRGRELTHQLLDFARHGDAMIQVLDLREVVAGIDPVIRRLIGPAIRVSVIRPLVSLPVRVDPGQLEQALINLAVNARDAMPDGGDLEIATSRGEADLAASGPAGADEQSVAWTELRVTDTGSGMSAPLIRSIFKPFFTTKPAGSGTGLGLAMVRGFTDNAGGRIRVESTVGQGTTFRILLPLAAPSAPDAPLPPTSRPRVWPVATRVRDPRLPKRDGGDRSPMGGTL